MKTSAIIATACVAVSLFTISAAPTYATTTSSEIATAPASAPHYSDKAINRLLHEGKVSKSLYNDIVTRTKLGRFYVLSGRQIAVLRVTHPDIFNILFEDKTHTKKLTAEQIEVVVALTIEELKNIKAGQAATPASPPTTSGGSGDSSKVDPDITLMVACFGTTGALFALPHPYSYIAAGAVFGGCTLLYGTEIYAKAIPKIMGQKPAGN